MEALSVSVLVVMLSLVAGSPVPDDPNRLISFAVTTPTPTPTTSLAEVHQNLSSVCETMLPDHGGSSPQSSAAPYKVSASPVTVKLGGVVSVVLGGLDGERFRGLFVEARDGNGQPLGHFLPSDDEHVTLTNCGSGTNNAVSYISRDPIAEFTFSWATPEEATTVRFRATVVKSFSEFWVGVESEPVIVKDESP